MKDYIDGEIKEMLGKIFPIDEIDQRFEDMTEAILDKKEEDPTYTVKHPLQLTVPFPTPEAEAKVAAEIQDKLEKERLKRSKQYLPTAARANRDKKEEAEKVANELANPN